MKAVRLEKEGLVGDGDTLYFYPDWCYAQGTGPSYPKSLSTPGAPQVHPRRRGQWMSLLFLLFESSLRFVQPEFFLSSRNDERPGKGVRCLCDEGNTWGEGLDDLECSWREPMEKW